MNHCKIKYILFFILILIKLNGHAQINHADSKTQENKKSYWKFLSNSDSTATKYFTGSIQFMQPISTYTFNSKWFYTNFGFNLARFFSKKIVLGPTCDWKIAPGGLNIQRLSQQFITDFNNGFNTNYTSSNDSSLAYMLKSQINKNGLYGNTFGNLGIMFSLYPKKYGGIFIYVKKGYKFFRTEGDFINLTVNPNGKEHFNLEMKNNYSFEISFKPYHFQNNNFIIFSAYFERLKLKSGSYENLKLTAIVNNEFISKYGITNSYGFTIGIGF